MQEYEDWWAVKGDDIRNKKLIQPNTKNFPVKLCTECNKVWEKSGKITLIHLDFPTYGLKRETCTYCTEKESESNV